MTLAASLSRPQRPRTEVTFTLEDIFGKFWDRLIGTDAELISGIPNSEDFEENRRPSNFALRLTEEKGP
jgi:hypothetical protein